MALMICPECKKEVSDSSNKCIHCGYTFKRQSKTPIIIGVIVVIFVIIGVIASIVLTTNKPIEKAQKSYSTRNIEAFSEIQSNLTDEDWKLISELANNDILDIKNEFDANEITYDDATTQIKEIIEYCPKEYITDYKTVLDDITALNKSREAFISAQTEKTNGNNEKAYKLYDEVIESDNNYQQAQDEKQNLLSIIVEEYVNQSKKYFENEDYSLAISSIQNAITYLPDDSELLNQKELYINAKTEYDKKIEEEKKKEALLVKNKEIEDNHFKATYIGHSFANRIFPDASRGMYYSCEPNEILLDMKFTIQNISNNAQDMSKIATNLIATYDTNTKYDNYLMIYTKNNDMEVVPTYASRYLDPLQKVTFHVIAKFPEEIETSDKALKVEFSFLGKNQLLEVR